MNAISRLAVSAAAIAALSLAITGSANAGEVTGTVLAYDRVAGVLVLTDKSSYPLDVVASDLPTTLSAGDRVTISFEGDESGITAINSVVILAEGDNT